MVSTDGTFEDVHFLGTAELSDDFAEAIPNIALENLLSVFGDPDRVVHTRVRGMVGVAILAATRTLTYWRASHVPFWVVPGRFIATVKPLPTAAARA
jgi:hypothetical protein